MPDCAAILPFRPDCALPSYCCVATLRAEWAARRNPNPGKAPLRRATGLTSAGNRQEAIQADRATTCASAVKRPPATLAPARWCTWPDEPASLVGCDLDAHHHGLRTKVEPPGGLIAFPH